MLADFFNSKEYQSVAEKYKEGPLSAMVQKHGSPDRSLLRMLQTLGVSFFIIFSAALWLAMQHVLQEVYSSSPDTAWTLRLLSVYIFGNLYGNYIFIQIRKPFYDPSKQPVSPDNSWSFCHTCQESRPPRSHHCPLCVRCVLKRDHHCFFTGICIGHDNQRFFLAFLVYAAWGTGHAAIILSWYLSDSFYEVLSLDVYNYFLPVTFTSWLFGYISLSTLGLVTLFDLSVGCAVFCTGYFCQQMRLVVIGRTSHEFMGSKTMHKTRLWDNVRSAFGHYGLLGFVLPLPSVAGQDDGIHWSSSKRTV